MDDPASPVSVAILAFPETSASVVYGIYDMLASDGRDWGIIVDGRPGATLIRPVVVAAKSGAFAASNGVTITPERSLDDCAHVDIACVPEINLPPDTPLHDRFTAELAWLARAYAEGATLATACSGAMLLAEAGLLDGLEATTHWAWCGTMKRRHPAVNVHAKRALVITGEGQRLVMAGGGTSWLDLALYLIGRCTNAETCNAGRASQPGRLARDGQQPFARLARSRQVDDAIIARCQEWIADHYREPAPVAAMARLSGLAERTFKRRFQAATGMSPLGYVHTLRLEEAKQMLESGNSPVDAIANEVGYEDAGFFSRLFRRNVNLTPVQYRKRFGAMRRMLEPAPQRRAVDAR